MKRTLLALACILSLVGTIPVLADGGVIFENIVEGDTNGVDYRRQPTPEREAALAAFMAIPPTLDGPTFAENVLNVLSFSSRGMPGVALLDYDNDGDLDIYATNGPGAANSLYTNQLKEVGAVTFIDRAVDAGVDATDQDSSGTCYGDIDNDGDADLYVLGTEMQNHLFENQGNGTFLDITATAGVGGDNRHPTSCSFADFNGDGYLDLVVTNTFDTWQNRVAFAPGPTYPGLEHNYIFMNQGGNVFVDASAASGLETVSNMDQPGLSGASWSWAVVTADYDLDGDQDILFADNQGPRPVDGDPLQERGYLRLYNNDGLGNFTERTREYGLDTIGGWMGLDFGDLNCDGYMDFFGSNLGWVGRDPSRWWFGKASGGFRDVGVGDLGMTPFGWGTAVIDYDNDGDSDILYHGGFHTPTGLLGDNPGTVLTNEGLCSGNFVWDSEVMITDHRLRQVQGVATGDLNQDGFVDVVSVSSSDIAPAIFLPMVGPPFFINPSFNSPFETIASFEATHAPFPPGSWTRIAPTDDNGVVIPQPLGTVAVELNSGDNGNGWVQVKTVGNYGRLEGARTNRDGIGATVFFTPDNGPTSARPVVGGSSFASQHDLTGTFGLGDAASGSIEILWPGGVRNRLDGVLAGERIVFPEIPCDFATRDDNPRAYYECVSQNVDQLVAQGLIDAAFGDRLLKSSAGPCVADALTHCFDDRFEVQVQWQSMGGLAGRGRAVTYSDHTAIFWLFDDENVDLHLKHIDGCAFNGYHWIYGAASTDVEYSVFVTDTQTSEVKVYGNTLGNAAPAITDSTAFATCP